MNELKIIVLSLDKGEEIKVDKPVLGHFNISFEGQYFSSNDILNGIQDFSNFPPEYKKILKNKGSLWKVTSSDFDKRIFFSLEEKNADINGLSFIKNSSLENYIKDIKGIYDRSKVDLNLRNKLLLVLVTILILLGNIVYGLYSLITTDEFNEKSEIILDESFYLPDKTDGFFIPRKTDDIKSADVLLLQKDSIKNNIKKNNNGI